MSNGVILYGPPAAGKNTVTDALAALDARYVSFPRLKAGGGRTTGYRMTTGPALVALRAAGDVIWENHRYGATYVVDRGALVARLAEHIPVLHLGQVDGVTAVTTAIPGARWTVVYLWCPRHIAEQRIRHRGTDDVPDRLAAYDQTTPLTTAAFSINTATTSADHAAREIHRHVDPVT